MYMREACKSMGKKYGGNMKTKKFSMKLTLNKKTIVNLNDNAMKEAHGGISETCRCPTYGVTSCGTDCYSGVLFPCPWVCR
jgi:hypothetical protein